MAEESATRLAPRHVLAELLLVCMHDSLCCYAACLQRDTEDRRGSMDDSTCTERLVPGGRNLVNAETPQQKRSGPRQVSRPPCLHRPVLQALRHLPTLPPPVSSPTGYTPCILPPAPSPPSGLDRCIHSHTTKSRLAPRFRRRHDRFTTFQNLGPDDPIATDADATSDSTHLGFFNRQLHTPSLAAHTDTPRSRPLPDRSNVPTRCL